MVAVVRALAWPPVAGKATTGVWKARCVVEAVEQERVFALVRRLSPDERALARARVLLVVMRARLAGRERHLEGLRDEAAVFERRYHARVGHYVAELERLEAEIADALARLHPADAALREAAASRARRGALVVVPAEVSSAGQTSHAGEGLKRLYLEVARRLHPDFAADECDRERRTRLMAEANRAYAEGDADGLQALLDDWEVTPDAFAGGEVAAALARVERAIARIAERLRAIAAEMITFRRSELWLLRAEVEAAERQGHDLLAELADEQRARVALARKQCAALGRRLRDRFGPRPARVLQFPEDRPFGTLFTRSRDEALAQGWQELGAARGRCVVPADTDVRLLLRRRADLAPLAALRPDDLQVLELAKIAVANANLVHLSALTGLRELDLSCNEIADAGLAHLAALTGLRRLDLSRCYVDGDGLIALDGLGGLEELSLAGPTLTDAALEHLGAFPLLRDLDLSHSAITDAGLAHLAALAGLKQLNLVGSAVSKAGLAALRHALPGCAIAGGRDGRRTHRPDPVRTLTELVAGG